MGTGQRDKEHNLADQPDFPAAGEHPGPDHIQAEASPGPIPEGEMPGVDPVPDRRRRTLELPCVDPHEFEESTDVTARGAIRRTGTDHDALPVIRLRLDPTEQQRDDTAGETGFETALDATQDDSGPQSDQG